MNTRESLVTRTNFVFLPITTSSGRGVCYHAFCEDPDGNALILHHRYAPPGAKPKQQ